MERILSGVSYSVILTSLALGICVLIELISPREHYRLRDRFPGAFFIVLLPVCAALMAWPLSVFWASFFHFRALVDLSGLPDALIVLIILLMRDFANYWQHRIDHWFLWPVHAVHHAQRELHAANGYGHPLQLFSEFFFIAVPLSLVETGGIFLPLVVALIVAVQAMVIHSPLRVHAGPLRYIFNDSRFHRVHHSIEPRHFNKNFATVFTLWDQMFGTAYFPQDDEWPAVGVDGLPNPGSGARILLYPAMVMRLSKLPSSPEDTEPRTLLNGGQLPILDIPDLPAHH